MLNDCDNAVPINVHPSPQIGKSTVPQQEFKLDSTPATAENWHLKACTPIVNVKDINVHHNMLMTTVSHS
jgi:hypothetical protein